MSASLFKNFKTLKEKEEAKKQVVEGSVSKREYSLDETENLVDEEKIVTFPVISKESDKVGEEIEIAPMVKKRPVKKEVAEARAKLTQIQQNAGSPYSKTMQSASEKRTFTIFMKEKSLEFIKDIVFYKATAERQIFYNQSDAVVEALSIIMPEYESIVPRPDFIREQEKNKKGGRKRNSDDIYPATTTVYIPSKFFDFVKDVTYNKVISGDLYFKDWDLLEAAVQLLMKRYGKKIVPRPDYIRQDEQLRGRRTKNEV